MVAFIANSQVVARYSQQITEDFARRKSIGNRDDLPAVSISLLGNRGFLVPVSECHADLPSVVRLLTEFRKPITTFPSFFEVTEERTHRWLRAHLLDVPDRILFFVVDPTGQIIGHVGLTHCLSPERTMELDNIVRGVPDAEPGLMSLAVRQLIYWSQATFDPSDIVLHVMQDNSHAIRFYERLGFVVTGSQPLRRIELPDEVRLEPFDTEQVMEPDGYYVTMTHRPATAFNGPHFPLGHAAQGSD